jgi:DNA repair protein RadC
MSAGRWPGLSGVRVTVVREAAPEVVGTAVRGPEDVARAVRALTDGTQQEEFWVFLLNTRHRIFALRMISRGTIDASLVHPREVFRTAVAAGAAAIILAHNHPSGDPEPSTDDRAVSRQVAAAGKVLGIPVLDHVVVGNDGGRFVSMAERSDL